jgi:hypothetical protein
MDLDLDFLDLTDAIDYLIGLLKWIWIMGIYKDFIDYSFIGMGLYYDEK